MEVNMLKTVRLSLFVVIMVVGFVSCGLFKPTTVEEVPAWSRYTRIPSKDFTVVGIVVVRYTDSQTISADLMEAAKALGADDIINVRVDSEGGGDDGKKILAASAVAIKYTAALYTGVTSDEVAPSSEAESSTPK
jgi:hypothetical protein